MMMMDKTDSTSAMASLASYAESDSEEDEKPTSAVDNISDEDIDTPTPMPIAKLSPSIPFRIATEDENSRSDTESVSKKAKKKTTTRLVSYLGDMDEEGEESESESEQEQSDDSTEHGKAVVEGKVMHSSLNSEQASSLSRSMLNKSLDEIELPPEPVIKCPRHLQEKIAKLYDRRRKEGINLNATIQNRVDFRNPSIYEKLIEFCGIDEKGTNYPPELFDPSIWGKESYYDALDKAQKADMEKREKERRERTKVEFVTATKKAGSKTEITSTISSRPDDKRRKSKWDAEPTSSQTQAGRIAESINKSIAASVNLTSIATGTKATVIPATGSIAKKPGK